jgi:hypothetical protein
MEGVAYVEGGGSVSGSQLWVAGDLRLRQLVSACCWGQAHIGLLFSHRLVHVMSTATDLLQVRAHKVHGERAQDDTGRHRHRTSAERRAG